jgi:hypothetical protein
MVRSLCPTQADILFGLCNSQRWRLTFSNGYQENVHVPREYRGAADAGEPGDAGGVPESGDEESANG